MSKIVEEFLEKVYCMNPMRILVNDQPCELHGEMSLGAFLEERQLVGIAAVNRKVIPASRWNKEQLREGDHVEMIGVPARAGA